MTKHYKNKNRTKNLTVHHDRYTVRLYGGAGYLLIFCFCFIIMKILSFPKEKARCVAVHTRHFLHSSKIEWSK